MWVELLQGRKHDEIANRLVGAVGVQPWAMSPADYLGAPGGLPLRGSPVEAAWDAAAGVASEHQWLTLADLISGDQPADAMPVFLRAIEPLRSLTGVSVYQQVAEQKVESVTLRGLNVLGKFKAPTEVEGHKLSTFRSMVPAQEDRDLLPLLREKGVKVEVQSEEPPRAVQLLGPPDSEPALLRAGRALEVRGDVARLPRENEVEFAWPTKR